MAEHPRIVVIGEGMLELSRGPGGSTKLAYGGDTLNTAVYLARLGLRPTYMTAIGCDPYSDEMLADWQDQGIDTAHVLRHRSRLPGLYAIATDADGERSFHYWRGESAAREFFQLPEHTSSMAYAATADWLYVSGITLSIFGPEERGKLNTLAESVHQRGGQVVFDPNFRPAGWPSVEAARKCMLAFCRNASILLPTIDDEISMFGTGTASHWLNLGADTVVLKCGADGARLLTRNGEVQFIPVPEAVSVTDSTGAGDSFNAAFIAGLMHGLPVQDAVLAGHRLAAEVVQHRGAIIPASAMPDVF